MFQPDQIIRKAHGSSFYLWVLNKMLNRMIPFNKPHGFRVLELSERTITTLIPYKRKNFNHIRGLHATALATLSEFTTGLMLLSILGITTYRIILKRLDIEYHYQGKMDATAMFEMTEAWLHEKVHQPLADNDSAIVPCNIDIQDKAGNKLTTATVYWQIKPWNKVKTKV